uniref:Uncharacterized protein n=1 Tax=Chromera velia CCMP2878 TaxID=1169474 RepID=A0A0G4HRU5_9ALVE|mmetsp:Transcript_7132/g.13996  ORF Transcript_7132/g.13996 Transcript_7132/m.13996 type:complete len:93 (+) Transcript_7132:152-430(+)|eukprot:Cvel_30811.t1-p1 / transcript=Cvel_30811.t1 / gene=Cvel_30811 / organism=Chromera_velia_CCMP2878 / gene_product=hypothetical protein / transcript_product=hypothetical protein / location=Cvel_scaffold4466:5165-7648(-) / protein_length=92 / sequence_SO=supercontig / SO=protein_coding / is_pseudo=false
MIAEMIEPRSCRKCRYCKSDFDVNNNPEDACRRHKKEYVCRYHPEGEKYYAAVEENPKDAHWAGKFWDCCGEEDPQAPGCAVGRHVAYGEGL